MERMDLHSWSGPDEYFRNVWYPKAKARRRVTEEMADLQKYRASELEKARTADLLRVLPKGRATVLDIGARDGFFSKILK
jgi:hypothetical protein